MRSALRIGLVAVTLAAGAPTSRADGASLVAIGVLPGDARSEAVGVSADGALVAGNSFDAGEFSHGFLWTAAGGLVALPAPGAGSYTFADFIAQDLSSDGSTVAGLISYFDPSYALVASEGGRWRTADGLVGLGDLAGDPFGGGVYSNAFACDADGGVIVGAGTDAEGTKAVRWDGTTISLVAGGYLPGNAVDGAAYAVSADGSFIAGDAATASDFSQRLAFRWSSAAPGTLVTLAALAGDTTSASEAISADGRIVAGWSAADSSGTTAHAVRWVDAGAPVSLGSYPGGADATFALGMSADGRRIAGEAATTAGQRAFVWDAAHGMRSLADALASLGVDTTGWTLERALAVSADGSTVVGVGTPPAGVDQGFVAYLPEPTAGGLGGAALAAIAALRARRRPRHWMR